MLTLKAEQGLQGPITIELGTIPVTTTLEDFERQLKEAKGEFFVTNIFPDMLQGLIEGLIGCALFSPA